MTHRLSEEARLYHSKPRPGKIEVRPTKPYSTQHDLTLAYSPGVAEPCMDIYHDPEKVYDYTAKGNLVAVISNGTAVLGLGDIGPAAGKPVMEGKGLLFKIYAGIDVFDIEINERDPERFVEIVKSLAPTFGGINLEDIKAPECFYIEERLKQELDIPVMHDDQHGTAIISAAGMLNALRIAGKAIEEIRVVVSGAGASGMSCARLYEAFGVRREHIVMVDSQGVIRQDRLGLSESKAYFATAREDLYTLEDAIVGADLFLGLSRPGVLTQEMIRQMAPNPIVFALANPIPEISYDEARAAREDVLIATGRSDYPNQINNVTGFPYIFRGALDVRARTINEEMKMAATLAIAELARETVPDEVQTAYGGTRFHFGRDYFIPKPVDPRLMVRVSIAVAKAAIASGVARHEITDWQAYESELMNRLGRLNILMQRIQETAKMSPRTLLYAAGDNESVLKAAVEVHKQSIAHPVLLGDETQIRSLASEHNINVEGLEFINHRSDLFKAKRREYAERYNTINWRKGSNLQEALDKMYDPNYFGMMMVEAGEADGLLTGLYSRHSHLAEIARSTVGLLPGHSHFATMHIVSMPQGPLFLADTMINHYLDAEALVDITLLAANRIRCWGIKPVIALISYSDYGSDDTDPALAARQAVEMLHRDHPELLVDGEMQLRTALNEQERSAKYPQNALRGQKVNTLIFPRLSAASASYQLLKEVGESVEVIGPIPMGLAQPIYFTDHNASVKDIVYISAMAAHEHSACIMP